MKNRNIYTKNGTVSGSGEVVRANFVCKQWQIQNTGSARLTATFAGEPVPIEPGEGFRLDVTAQEVVLTGSTTYTLEASELLGSLDMA